MTRSLFPAILFFSVACSATTPSTRPLATGAASAPPDASVPVPLSADSHAASGASTRTRTPSKATARLRGQVATLAWLGRTTPTAPGATAGWTLKK